MSIAQYPGLPLNSAANSLPTPVWGPKTLENSAAGQCDQILVKHLIYIQVSARQGRFSGAETGFFLADREMRRDQARLDPATDRGPEYNFARRQEPLDYVNTAGSGSGQSAMAGG